jgi:hypothetical protein
MCLVVAEHLAGTRRVSLRNVNFDLKAYDTRDTRLLNTLQEAADAFGLIPSRETEPLVSVHRAPG